MGDTLLLLTALLFLLLALIGEVNLDTELVAELIDTGTARADDAADVLALDIELDRVAAHNLVVLRVLGDLADLGDGAGHIRTDAVHDDEVFRGLAGLGTKFD